MANIDILWIHDHLTRKYNSPESSYQHRTTTTLKEEEININRFGYYLIRSFPILNRYRLLLKQKNKINFLDPQREEERVQDNDSDEQDHDCSSFSSYSSDPCVRAVDASSTTATIMEQFQRCVQEYLQTVKIFFPEEYYKCEWSYYTPSTRNSGHKKMTMTQDLNSFSSSSSSSVSYQLKKKEIDDGYDHHQRRPQQSGEERGEGIEEQELEPGLGIGGIEREGGESEENDDLLLILPRYPPRQQNRSLADTHLSSILQPKQIQFCKRCHSSMDQFHIFENHLVCSCCGLVLNALHSTSSYKDMERINISSKYLYDRRIHFRNSISQFQGKQNAKIDAEIYNKIIEQLYIHGLIPDNYEDLPKEVAFQEVTKEQILLFMKENHFTKHYDDLTLIHHQLTGKPAPDISHLEVQLLNDFDILVEMYDKKFKKKQGKMERKNFINTQYVLYILLRRHKYPCRKEEFNMLKTIDRQHWHDIVCSELFSEIGWSFNAVF